VLEFLGKSILLLHLNSRLLCTFLFVPKDEKGLEMSFKMTSLSSVVGKEVSLVFGDVRVSRSGNSVLGSKIFPGDFALL